MASLANQRFMAYTRDSAGEIPYAVKVAVMLHCTYIATVIIYLGIYIRQVLSVLHMDHKAWLAT